MGVVDYVFILPAVTAGGWALSWWGPRRIRWGLLPVAAVVSVLCVAIGFLSEGPPVTPGTRGCSPIACTDLGWALWVATGLLGFGCCVALLVLTVVVEAVMTRTGREP